VTNIPAAGRMPDLQILAVAVAAAIIFFYAVDPAMAQSSTQLFTTMTKKGCEVFNGARQMLYIGIGLGLVALCALAAFGRFKWPWFFGMVGGVALMAIFDQIMQFLDFGNFNTNC